MCHSQKNLKRIIFMLISSIMSGEALKTRKTISQLSKKTFQIVCKCFEVLLPYKNNTMCQHVRKNIKRIILLLIPLCLKKHWRLKLMVFKKNDFTNFLRKHSIRYVRVLSRVWPDIRQCWIETGSTG